MQTVFAEHSVRCRLCDYACAERHVGRAHRQQVRTCGRDFRHRLDLRDDADGGHTGRRARIDCAASVDGRLSRRPFSSCLDHHGRLDTG